MAKNYDSEGNVVEVTAPVGGVISGNVYRVGSFIGVATGTVAAGERFELGIEQVWAVNKVTAEPWTEGMFVYFNTGSALASSVSTGTVYLGVALDARVNPSTTGRVKLNYGKP